MDPFVTSTSNSHSNVNDQSNDTCSDKVALPLRLQQIENACNLDSFIRQVQSIVASSSTTLNNDSVVSVSKQQARTVKTRLYNLSKVKKTKKWFKDIVLEKSDSSDSDLEMPVNGNTDTSALYEDSINDMIKFQNLKKKLKQNCESIKEENTSTDKTLKFYSSELLGTNLGLMTQSIGRSSTNEESPSTDHMNGPSTTHNKSRKNKASSSSVKATSVKKKSNRSTPSPSPATPTTPSFLVKDNSQLDRINICNVVGKNSLLIKSGQSSPSVHSNKSNNSTIGESSSKIDSPIIHSTMDNLNSTSVTSQPKQPQQQQHQQQQQQQLNSSLSLSVDSVDSIRYKERLLDEIPYDMTLPDEILQTESSFNASETLVSRSRVTEDIVYNTNLPDEIFDTEESNISVISQTLSSPSPSMSLYNPTSSVKLNSAISRPVTAPSTPTGLTSSHSVKRKSKSLQPRRHMSKSNLTVLSANASPDTTDAFQRKKLWMYIVKNEILKSHQQMMTTKVSNSNIRKMLAETFKNGHIEIITKLREFTSLESGRSTRDEMIQFWSNEYNVTDK